MTSVHNGKCTIHGAKSTRSPKGSTPPFQPALGKLSIENKMDPTSSGKPIFCNKRNSCHLSASYYVRNTSYPNSACDYDSTGKQEIYPHFIPGALTFGQVSTTHHGCPGGIGRNLNENSRLSHLCSFYRSPNPK